MARAEGGNDRSLTRAALLKTFFELGHPGDAIEQEGASAGMVFLEQAAEIFATSVETDFEGVDGGTLGLFAERVDGSLDFSGVLGGNGDLFAAEFDCSIDNG